MTTYTVPLVCSLIVVVVAIVAALWAIAIADRYFRQAAELPALPVLSSAPQPETV